jgi:hypothetical protein
VLNQSQKVIHQHRHQRLVYHHHHHHQQLLSNSLSKKTKEIVFLMY